MDKLKVVRVVMMFSVMTILVTLLTLFLGGNYTVYNLVGVSMKPTYEDGDLVVLNKNKDIEREDVIIFEYTGEEYRGTYVKRVVGLPGDAISSDDEGNLKLNGELYKNSKNGNTVKLFVDKTLKIPHNSYYVIGDNEDNSLDSRVLGVIDEEDISGVVTSIHIKGR